MLTAKTIPPEIDSDTQGREETARGRQCPENKEKPVRNTGNLSCHAILAREVLAFYARRSGNELSQGSVRATAADLITDIMHLCAETDAAPEKAPFRQITAVAEINYESEKITHDVQQLKQVASER